MWSNSISARMPTIALTNILIGAGNGILSIIQKIAQIIMINISTEISVDMVNI